MAGKQKKTFFLENFRTNTSKRIQTNMRGRKKSIDGVFEHWAADFFGPKRFVFLQL